MITDLNDVLLWNVIKEDRCNNTETMCNHERQFHIYGTKCLFDPTYCKCRKFIEAKE